MEDVNIVLSSRSILVHINTTCVWTMLMSTDSCKEKHSRQFDALIRFPAISLKNKNQLCRRSAASDCQICVHRNTIWHLPCKESEVQTASLTSFHDGFWQELMFTISVMSYSLGEKYSYQFASQIVKTFPLIIIDWFILWQCGKHIAEMYLKHIPWLYKY